MLEYLCKLTRTPTGGIVFDPFIGSGTTAIAAIKTGRPFYGCDNNQDYVDIATARMEKARQDVLQMEMELC
jgi:DNA modification methylase